MKGRASISKFRKTISSLNNWLRMNGETMEEQKIVEKTLRSLASRFDMIVSPIEEVEDLSMLIVDELKGSFQNHEKHLNRSENYSQV